MNGKTLGWSKQWCKRGMLMLGWGGVCGGVLMRGLEEGVGGGSHVLLGCT